MPMLLGLRYRFGEDATRKAAWAGGIRVNAAAKGCARYRPEEPPEAAGSLPGGLEQARWAEERPSFSRSWGWNPRSQPLKQPRGRYSSKKPSLPQPGVKART